MTSPTCPSAEVLLAGLTPELEAHIDGCAECRAVMSAGARGEAPPRFGRYRLDTVLGAGGMGIVYRAWDPELARAVAIKVLKRAGDGGGDERLAKEARSLARVTHANVCRVYDVGSDGDELWVAMELIDGTTLREHVGDPWPALLAAAEGLAAAHDAGVVHRDVKPENVLVARDGRAVVTDFGLARADEVVDPAGSTVSGATVATASGVIAGTPAYLAPEQLSGAAVDARCDQFAWAVMAWELSTGARPFPAVLSARLDAIRAGVTAPMVADDRVFRVLQRAMSVAPRDRYGSMRELAAAVRMAHAPVRRPPGRKSKLPTIAAGLAAAVIGGVAFAKLGMNVHSEETAPAPAAAPAPATGSAPAPATGSATGSDSGSAAAPAAGSGSGSGSGSAAVAGSGSVAVPVAVPGSGSGKPKPMPRAEDRRPKTEDRAVSDDDVLDALDPPLTKYAALAYLDDECSIPIDFAHPDPALHGAIADYGKVTKAERIQVSIATRTTTQRILEVQGQRGTYSFSEDQHGRITARVGDTLLVCPQDTDDPWHADGVVLWRLVAAIKISRAPRTGELSALDPIHVHGLSKKLDPARRYLLHASIKSVDGDTATLLGGTTLTIASGVQLRAGTQPWIVVENKDTIVKAIDDLFP